ncbi:MAG: hypothetical protein MK193_07800 [Lentisphaeria bacterium]|nr:hypothetical protein [Lentisphaeria bacterium]
MFRKQAYEEVGGYRDIFYYAQDSDLWLRLGEIGDAVSVPDICYELYESSGSVSATNRSAQAKFCEIAQYAYKRRVQGQSDESFILEAKELRKHILENKGQKTKQKNINTNRLIASKLLKNGNKIYTINYDDVCRRFFPGLYTSMNQSWKVNNKFKACFYPKEINEYIHQPSCIESIDQKWLYSFRGTPNSYPIRKKIFENSGGTNPDFFC